MAVDRDLAGAATDSSQIDPGVGGREKERDRGNWYEKRMERKKPDSSQQSEDGVEFVVEVNCFSRTCFCVFYQRVSIVV